MNSVIFASHDRINVPIHSIVNVRCPNGSKKYHTNMGQVVAGDEWQKIDVRTCLQHAIERMKGNRSPGGEGFGAVVIMVFQMYVFVEKLIGMQSTMHPVNSYFYAKEIQAHRRKMILPST